MSFMDVVKLVAQKTEEIKKQKMTSHTQKKENEDTKNEIFCDERETCPFTSEMKKFRDH
jgi:hypothetical protein